MSSLETYEVDRVSTKGISWVVVGFLVAAIMIHIGAAIVMIDVPRKASESEKAHPSVLSVLPSPRLQVDEPADFRRHLRSERQILGSYGWEQDGFVRVPIERGIDIYLERKERR